MNDQVNDAIPEEVVDAPQGTGRITLGYLDAGMMVFPIVSIPELGVYGFNFNEFSIKLNTYYIKTKDLIQWRPDNLGVWKPINVAKSESYGAEIELQSKLRINKHHFNFNSHYSYTVSENLETKAQLIYVPFHKGNIALSYSFKSLSAYYQHVFNDEVFIIGNSLDGYNVGNLGFSYTFNSNGKFKYEINFKVNNLYNNNYQNVSLRPMPNRNYQILTTIKF